MAEAIAAIGAAAAILQSVDYGAKVIKRLDGFALATDSVPESYWNVKVQLPLIINPLHHMQAQPEKGSIGEEAAST